MTKIDLRQEMKDRLAEQAVDERMERSKRIVERILESEFWKDAGKIGLFASRRDEPELSGLWAGDYLAGKEAFYPKTVDDQLVFGRVSDLHALQPGRWGLLEPSLEVVNDPDLILVPGVAFDRGGGRLGRGGGFYDRYFSQNRTKRLGVAFSFQIVEQVPIERHDARMDEVITD